MLSQSSVSILQPTALTCVASGSDETVTVGQEPTGAVTYQGGDIDSNVTAVTDIDDPSGTGGWTTLLTLSGGPLIISTDETTIGIGKIIVDTLDAGAGKDLRMQILIDGEIVSDVKIESSSGDTSAEINPLQATDNEYFLPLFCGSTFLVRAARKGSFSDNGSQVVIPVFKYDYVKKV